MEFDYFTQPNKQEIYIKDRGEYLFRYAVYEGSKCIQNELNKREAFQLANELYRLSQWNFYN